MRTLLLGVLLGLSGLLSVVASATAQCVGDCDLDGQVTVDELLVGVNLALSGGTGACMALDVDGNQVVTVDELILAIDLALRGCQLTAPALPELVSSRPVASEEAFARFDWLELHFDGDVDPASQVGFKLTCSGVHRAAGVHLTGPRTVVVNPTRDLPPASACELTWPSGSGSAVLSFTTAAAGAAGTVLYDRNNLRLTTPYPDDFWLKPDASKPNGVVLAMQVPSGPSGVRGIFRALLRGTTVLDGFSPIGHVVLELSDAPQLDSLPRTSAESLDPMASIGLFDIAENSPTFGARIPFRVDVRDDTNVSHVRSHALLIFPSIPLEPGGRYGLIVTRRMRIDDARPFDPSPFFDSILRPGEDDETPAAGRVRELSTEVIAAVRSVAGEALQEDDIALAVRITVRTTDDIPRDLAAIRQQVTAAPPPAFSIKEVRAESHPYLAATVTGEWDAPDWRQGVYFKRDENGLPLQTKTNRIPFTLAIPRAAAEHPVPITMYQHGNPGSSEREVPSDARKYLAQAGFAVVGFTDNLNREVSAGSANSVEAITRQITAIFFALLQNQKVPDFWVELNGEQLAFLQLIQSLGTIDVLPLGAPDGVPDLDPTLPLSYVGISQGANYAPGFLPYAPEISAAAVVAGGARLAEVLIYQQPEALLDQIGALYPDLTGADIWVGLALFQAIYDNQDEHNHARFIYRDPIVIDGTQKKASILLLEGLDDTLVPNHATNSLAFSMGPIPHLLPVQRPVPFLQTITGPVKANIDASTTAAFYQYVPVGVAGIDATPGCAALGETEGHYCAQSAEESLRQRTVFFQTMLSDGVPTIIDPLNSSEGGEMSADFADVMEVAH